MVRKKKDVPAPPPSGVSQGRYRPPHGGRLRSPSEFLGKDLQEPKKEKKVVLINRREPTKKNQEKIRKEQPIIWKGRVKKKERVFFSSLDAQILGSLFDLPVE